VAAGLALAGEALMDGWAHAGSGMAVGVLVGLTFRAGPAHTLLDGAVVGGAALLPDADHKDAAISHTLGALTWALTSALGKVTGGHRHFLHWFAGVITVSALCAVPLIDHSAAVDAVATVLLGICIMAALKVTRLARAFRWKYRVPGVFLAGMGLAAAAVFGATSSLWWLVAIGMVLHIAEDLTTGNGRWLASHMFWPIPGLIAHRRKKIAHEEASRERKIAQREARASRV
jgi:hypothetical protein